MTGRRKRDDLLLFPCASMTTLQAIFFDIGDTLVFDDPPLRERFWIATQRVGLAYPKEALPGAFRQGEDYAVARYLEGLPFETPPVLRETTARILDALGVSVLTDAQRGALAEAFWDIPWTRYVHPQAIPLLETLRARGFRVGAISDWEETLPNLLADLGLAPYLDTLAVSALVGATKPSARLFEEGLRQSGVEPASAIHIGDWYELDVAGARSVGMDGVLFDHQVRRPDADCRRVVTFEELTLLLLSLPCPVQ